MADSTFLQDKTFIRLEGISKSYGAIKALDGVNLSIARGELFCLLGSSGCGKTTLLRILAGLESPTAGVLLLDNEDITERPPYLRPVHTTFQSYALFPHLNVADNIAFGLRRAKWPKKAIVERTEELLSLIKLEGFAKRKPRHLSGGQQQRVALARSLARKPKVLLLDEPLAALDKQLREETQFELMRIQESLGTTFILVTHDQEEAMTLACRMAVMDQGRVVQVGTPRQVYRQPVNRHVASFFGTVNLMPGQITNVTDSKTIVKSDDLNIMLELDHPYQDKVNKQITLALRPEHLVITASKAIPPTNAVRAKITIIAFRGGNVFIQASVNNKTTLKITLNGAMDETWQEDQDVLISWQPQHLVPLFS